MTRGEFVQALYQSYTVLHGNFGTEELNGTGILKFADVTLTSNDYDAICWAREYGISFGYDQNHFCPESLISREQAAVMLYRYKSIFDALGETESDALSNYSDAAELSTWSRSAITWAVSYGIWFSGSTNILNAKAYLCNLEGNAMIFSAFFGGMKHSMIENINDCPDMTMEIISGTVSASGVTIKLNNHGNTNYSYGSYYCLEENINGAWYVRASVGVPAFTMIAYMIEPGENSIKTYNWESLYGILPEGAYRIIIIVSEEALSQPSSNYYLTVEFLLDKQ